MSDRNELVIDDIWTDQGGVSLRVSAMADGRLRVEFTKGVSERAEHEVTLQRYRAIRLAKALSAAFPPDPSR